VEYFLQLGQNSNLEREGGTPLMSAAANGNIEILNYCLNMEHLQIILEMVKPLL
jgi:ankyrin repeat protein